MQFVLFHLTTIAVIAVLIVLVLGLGNLLRTDSANTSQRLMRWRVGLQFLAVVIIMAALLVTRR